MRRVIRDIAGWSAGLTFALAPIILLITYITYTEKIILPILMLMMMVSLIILIVTDKEE